MNDIFHNYLIRLEKYSKDRLKRLQSKQTKDLGLYYSLDLHTRVEAEKQYLQAVKDIKNEYEKYTNSKD